MLVGYARVSKNDGSQILDPQKDALLASGVKHDSIYEDYVSGKSDDRPGLNACLKALREGDTLIVWKLDRLGRNLKHLLTIIDDLEKRHIGFKVLTGHGVNIDTNTPNGKLVFGIFASIAEYERTLIGERTKAGLQSARARGRKGGRSHKMTIPKLRLAQASMNQPGTKVADLCKELAITRQTLYRYVNPKGQLRLDGNKLLKDLNI
jgi:DNA invertase Pin-like site-specific DNA recombinase